MLNINVSLTAFDWKIAVFVFFVYFVVDVLYARYTFGVVNYKPHHAAINAVMIYTLISIGVLSLFTNLLYLIPLALGSYLGTFLTVRRERNKNTNILKDLNKI